MTDLSQTFFCCSSLAIITGASRGIGRAIAIEFAKRFEDRLHLVLTARTVKGLQETSSLIESLDKYSPERISVTIVPGDLRDGTEFPGLLDKLFSDIDSAKYQQAVLINNAASPGDISLLVRDFSPVQATFIQEYFFSNVTSTLLLNSRLISSFPMSGQGSGATNPVRRTIVQVTSGSAIRAHASFSLYCSGKAARDMLHKVVAVEEPSVRVLSYDPGEVDTAMLRQITHSISPVTAKLMTDLLKVAVTPERTAGVLCDLLHKDEYESGAHVSLYDIIGEPDLNSQKT